MARPTPYVRESVLTCPGVDGSPQSLLIGSPDWYRWLADETHRSFAFESPRGTFTASKERKQRGGWYWTAYRQSQGKLYKAYLGRSEEVTPERLEGVASLLVERIAGQRRTTNDQRPTTNDQRPTTDDRRPTTDERRPTSDDQGLSTDPNSKLITHNPKLVSDILTTKLYVPRTRPGLVPRPRLVGRLDAGLSGALTLVCAPAGFGKTTLLTDWLGQQDELRPGRTRRPAAWLSLDGGDNDLLQFLRYLIAALQTVAPSTGAALLSLLHPGITQQPSLPSLLTLLINDLAVLPAESILVLDDYHVLSEPRIHEAITFLLDHLPPQLHVVIVTRVDPPLPLSRLRAHGLLTEVRAADLRFTTEEAAAFLTEVMRLPLSPADVLALEERTEGWIAGLQFAALAMRDRSDLQSFVDAFTGSHRYILDYLVEEVLMRQPPHLQTFLLQTSILDRLCGPLCDSVVSVHCPRSAKVDSLFSVF